MIDYSFDQLIDIAQIQRLLSLFYKATGIPAGIISQDGRVLIVVGGQDICTKFHRVHPVSLQRCILNNGYVKEHSDIFRKNFDFKCSNGLYHIGVPISLENNQVGVLWLGPFFYEDTFINRDYFLNQAFELGFNTESYMCALDKVSIFNKEKVKAILSFFSSFVNFLSVLAVKNLKLMDEIKTRKETQEALKISQQRLELALHGTNLGLWDWRIDTGDVILDHRWIAMLGYSLYEIIPSFKTWESLIHPDDLPAVIEAMNNHIEGRTNMFISEHRLKTKWGKWKWVLNQGKIVEFDKMRKPSRMTGTIMDITERKNAEHEREKFVKLLMEKNKEQERFNYSVTHDLKSPLVTIREFLKLLEKDISGNNMKNVPFYISRMANASGNMIVMLEQLLEFSKITKITNPFKQISFYSLVKDVIDLLGGEINSANVTVEVSPDLPDVYGDKFRLSSLVQNLIDNAVKYMGDQPNPLIKIGYDSIDEYKVVFYIQDNGMGIDDSYGEKIFNLFEKLNPTSDGTGLGLALAKRIVEMHGGKIWLESEGSGKGCTFKFTLPLKEKIEPADIIEDLQECRLPI